MFKWTDNKMINNKKRGVDFMNKELHEHHHDDDCCCGHDHHEHDHHEHHHVAENIPADHKTKVYTIENLGCANCAAKMESRINQLEEVSDATITFATKQLRVSAKNPDALLNEIQEICAALMSEYRL